MLSRVVFSRVVLSRVVLSRLAFRAGASAAWVLFLVGCTFPLTTAPLTTAPLTTAPLTQVDLDSLSRQLPGLIEGPYEGLFEVKAVPFFPQQTHQCGPASLAMLLTWSGLPRQPQQLTEAVFLPGQDGSIQAEMLATVRRHGRLSYELTGGLLTLATELKAGHPVLVLQNLGLSWLPRWHYAVVTGLNLQAASVRLHSGTRRDYALNLATFLHTWQRAGYWAAVVLTPDQLPASAEPQPYLRALLDLQQSLARAPLTGGDPLPLPPWTQTAYQTAVARWPESILLKLAFANGYLSQEQPVAAEQVLRETLQQDPNNASAHNNLALALLAQQRQDEALEHAQVALALGGKHREAFRDTLTQIQSALPDLK